MPDRKHPHHAHHPRPAHHVELDGGDAFVPDYRKGFVVVPDGDAEALGEELIASVTSGEPVAESARDEILNDELAGLTVESVEEEEE
jgi:hypothetical protein